MSLADFSNRDVVILGCGSIFMGSIQLLIQEINLTPERITVISNTEAPDLVHTLNLNFQQQHLTTDNILNVLSQYAKPNCLLINLSVNVSSLPVIEYCQKKNILYFDTSYECWKTSPEGIDFDTEFCLASERNNLLEIKPQSQSQQTTTALTEHGANPGMVSHFVKQAIMNEAKRVFGDTYESPKTRLEWAQLSHQLGIESIHIAERDTQIDRRRRRANEMFSTWSMDGLLTKASDPLHFAWGTHESHIPEQTKGHISHQGNVCSLHGKVRSVSTKIHSVTPKYGAFHGFVIPHIEAFSLGEYLSIHEDNKLIYQPTILFAYQPCDDAVLSLHDAQAAAWQTETLENYLMMDIEEGTDALGVVLHMRGQDHYQWFGSEVSTSDFKAFPHNNATSLQVVAGVISGIAYIVNNPNQGILEPEDLPYETMIELAKPYLGHLFSYREAFPTKTLKLRSGEHWYFNELIVKDDQ